MDATPREIRDDEGITWTCLQAFAGLTEAGSDEVKEAAARVAGTDRVQVVCTPSGGARSRRLHLPADWARMSDEALAETIAAAT